MKKEKLESWITRCVAKEAGLRPHEIDAKAPLVTYMLNGFQSFRVVADLGAIVGQRLPETLLYSKQTIAELADHLAHQLPMKRSWAASVQRISIGPLGRIDPFPE